MSVEGKDVKTISGKIYGGERKRTIDKVSKIIAWHLNLRLTLLQDKSSGNLSFRKQGRNSKWKTHESKSTDDEHRGGITHISDQVS